MRGWWHETRDLDARRAPEPLAAASPTARDAVDRTDLGDRAMERRAGAEPAGARVLRSRRRDLRRHAHRNAGRQWPDILASAVRKTAPRRLAGVAGAGRPRANSGAFLPP